MTDFGRCVVIGGAGAVGTMFAELLAGSGAEVRVVDTAAPGDTGFLRGDITDVDPPLRDALAAADIVLLAVPEQVALAAVETLGAILSPDALLVDSLSVKTRFLEAVRRLRCQVLSVNPMFAPSLGMADRPVVAVVVRDGPRVQDLLRLMANWGARVVEVDEHEHDRLTGAAQVLTHATVLGFGLALDRLDVDLARLGAIAPPPHAVLLALLARICSGTPEVYWDVQAANPHGPQVRAELAHGLRRLADLVEHGDEAGFTAALTELRQLFGDDLARYQEMCARLFTI